MGDDIITKPFRVMLKDHLIFALSAHYRTAFLTPYALLYALPILGLPILIFISNPDENFVSAWVTFGWMSGWLLVLVPLLQLYPIRRAYLTSPLLHSEHTAQLSETGFRVISHAFDSETGWSNFSKLRESKTKIYLHLTANMTHIVPKSAFYTSEDARQFIDRAREGIAQARHSESKAFIKPAHPPVSKWQTQPYHYSFSLHIKTYMHLSYGIIRRPFMSLFLPGVLVTILLLVNREAIIDGYWDEVVPQLIGMAVLYLGFVTIFPWIMAPLSWLNARKLATTKGLRIVSLLPDKMVTSGQSYHAELPWGGLKGIAKGGGYMLVFTRPNCAISIPNSAFPDKAAAKAFYDQALTYFNAAKAAAKSTPDAKTLDGKT